MLVMRFPHTDRAWRGLREFRTAPCLRRSISVQLHEAGADIVCRRRATPQMWSAPPGALIDEQRGGHLRSCWLQVAGARSRGFPSAPKKRVFNALRSRGGMARILSLAI